MGYLNLVEKAAVVNEIVAELKYEDAKNHGAFNYCILYHITISPYHYINISLYIDIPICLYYNIFKGTISQIPTWP